ncbi:unnamed protein product, partial [Musa textilis]
FNIFVTGRHLRVPEHVVSSIISCIFFCRGFLYEGSSCSRTLGCRTKAPPSSNWEKRSHLGTPLVSPKLMPLLGVVLCLVHSLDAQARS